MPAVVDLKEPVAAVIRDADDAGVELALPSSDLDGSFFEFVWPDVTDDLNDLCIGVVRVGGWRRIGDADRVFGLEHGRLLRLVHTQECCKGDVGLLCDAPPGIATLDDIGWGTGGIDWCAADDRNRDGHERDERKTMNSGGEGGI